MKKYLILFAFISISFADYTKNLDKIAGKLIKEIPQDRTVVVFNILKDGRTETENSVDLAIKLGMKLAEKGKKKFTVIDRAAGEKLVYEEENYTVRSFTSEELVKILEGFKADIGVIGQYQLLGNCLILENIRAVAVPSPENPSEVISSYDKLTIQLKSQDSLCLIQKEILLPQPPDSITNYFLTASTENNFVCANIVDIEGKLLSDNCAKIGSYYRLKIDLEEPTFLYVFSYDEDNNAANLLHPLNKVSDKLVQKGSFLLPQGDNVMEAKTPAGRNFLKIFTSRKPIPFNASQSEDMRLTFAEVANFVNELKKLSPDDWASYRIFIHIVEK